MRRKGPSTPPETKSVTPSPATPSPTTSTSAATTTPPTTTPRTWVETPPVPNETVPVLHGLEEGVTTGARLGVGGEPCARPSTLVLLGAVRPPSSSRTCSFDSVTWIDTGVGSNRRGGVPSPERPVGDTYLGLTSRGLGNHYEGDQDVVRASGAGPGPDSSRSDGRITEKES